MTQPDGQRPSRECPTCFVWHVGPCPQAVGHCTNPLCKVPFRHAPHGIDVSPARPPADGQVLGLALEAAAVVTAEWLRSIGYGFDFAAPDHPLPEWLRRPLAEAWWRDAGCPRDEPVEEWMTTLDEEGAW